MDVRKRKKENEASNKNKKRKETSESFWVFYLNQENGSFYILIVVFCILKKKRRLQRKPKSVELVSFKRQLSHNAQETVVDTDFAISVTGKNIGRMVQFLFFSLFINIHILILFPNRTVQVTQKKSFWTKKKFRTLYLCNLQKTLREHGKERTAQQCSPQLSRGLSPCKYNQ